MLDFQLLLPGDWIDSAVHFHKHSHGEQVLYGTLVRGPGLTMKVESLPRLLGVIKVGDIWVDTHSFSLKVVDTEVPIEGRIPADSGYRAELRDLALTFAGKQLMGESEFSVPVHGRKTSLQVGDYLIGRVTRDIHGALVRLNAMALGEVTAVEWDMPKRGVRVDGHDGRYWVSAIGRALSCVDSARTG